MTSNVESLCKVLGDKVYHDMGNKEIGLLGRKEESHNKIGVYGGGGWVRHLQGF